MFFFEQIKPSGDDADKSPTLTFSLSSNAGFHVEFFSDHDGPLTKYPIMPLTNVTGKWIQVDFQNTLLRTFIN